MRTRTRNGTGVLRWAAVLAGVVAVLLAGAALAQDEPVEWSFAKEDPDGDATWEGTVGGPADGELQTVLLAADQSEPVWLVSFEGVVDAGDRSFTAHVGGTLDTQTGEVRMVGVVTDGFMLGSSVDWQGQMVDEEASRFEGTIRVSPPGRDAGM